MKFIHWGEIIYSTALDQQSQMVEKVIANPEQEAVIFCRHPSVVTLGKKTKAEDLAGWSGETFPVKRGGSATYHGLGQTVVYPILYLGYRNRDLHLLLRSLEKSLVETLDQLYSLKAQGKRDDATGVWVNGFKLASIGIAVRKWVSYHGMAVNLYKDPRAFTGIRPCGFSTQTMISLEELLGKIIDRNHFERALEKNLSKYLAPNNSSVFPAQP